MEKTKKLMNQGEMKAKTLLNEVPVGKESEKKIKALLRRGKKKGYLTYEEINNALPDDIVSASRLEELLTTLDEMGINLVDKADVDPKALDDSDVFDNDGLEESLEPADEVLRKDRILEIELVKSEASQLVDRFYNLSACRSYRSGVRYNYPLGPMG